MNRLIFLVQKIKNITIDVYIRQRKNKKSFFILFIILGFTLILADNIFARAGGAGSYSSGSSDGDGLFYLIYYIIRLIPFPYNLIILGIGIPTYLYVQKKMNENTVFNSIPNELQNTNLDNLTGYEDFMQTNPEFDSSAFLNDVKKAFVDVQTAWANGDISPVRRYISDGVYQRFNTQMKMMSLLKQKNTLNDIQVINAQIDKLESDGNYDIIHVAIQAQIDDKFESELDSSLNSGGLEQFIEYWSFLRKKGAKPGAIFTSNLCPNCGGALPDNMGEVAKCEFCESFVNNAEYDWVLAEITQADDYVSGNASRLKSSTLADVISDIRNKNPDFCVQMVEDKVSNGYLQIISSVVFKDTEIMQRFASEEMQNKIKSSIEENDKTQIAYNRLYLNEVELMGAGKENKKDLLMFYVKSSFQRVQIEGDDDNKQVSLIDLSVFTKTEVVVMSRDENASKPKGSAFANSCPSCGAPLDDSMKTKCGYCDAILNSTSLDWVITNIMSIDEYNNYASENKDSINTAKTSDLDSLYKVRDFAMNNVMVMAAVDGKIDPAEIEFIEKMAKKWGYNNEKIQGLYQMAIAQRLSIKMPNDEKSIKKIIKLMEKVAKADDDFAESEQQLLEDVKNRYLTN